MNKKEKAFEYAKMRYGNNGNETQNEMAKMIACRVGYEAGWDEALKSQWVRVEERLPERCKIVFVLHSNMLVGVSAYHYDNNWSNLEDDIIAWMPIPSFEKILEDNKDVLKRLKDK